MPQGVLDAEAGEAGAIASDEEDIGAEALASGVNTASEAELAAAEGVLVEVVSVLGAGVAAGVSSVFLLHAPMASRGIATARQAAWRIQG